MSQSSGIDEGREIVREIVRKQGFVSASTLKLIATISEEARREVEEALLQKDKTIGSSVLVLAKNLYTSKVRFVFELLQNADDNQYTRGQVPCVVFRVHPTKIIIECNEDGFTRQNLAAICNVGKSSKTGSQCYIGEKGIGFKSVFMAAWKVHIQSGNFSFEFVHRETDSGMGMITPIWQDTRDPNLPFGLTRITMYLIDTPDKRDKVRASIYEQFHALQDTLLLFLRKLRIIEFSFHDEEGIQTECTIDTLSRSDNSDIVIIERKCTDETKNRRRIYHTTRHLARNLEKSENRDLSGGDEETKKSFATSDIVLAFPVTKDTVPIVEPQDVFAFLPMKKMGFNFLIQADFVTVANREDIVMTSARNRGLIEAISDAFIAGVSELCQHPELQYLWMRYLPMEGTYQWSGLWLDLVSSIKSKIERLTVFRSLERSTCRTINDLYCLQGYDRDLKGAPLFADLPTEVYLSDAYEHSDLAILKNFGLNDLPFAKHIEMVKRDLQAGFKYSRIKSRHLDDGWQTSAYTLLNRPWEQKLSHEIQEVKQLEIIPLQDGSWVSSNSGDIFHPTYNNIAVPKDLGMRLVDPAAIKNESRRAFFTNLGVQEIKMPIVSKIRERILRRLAVPGTIASLESSIERTRFLFFTKHLHSKEGGPSDKFAIYDHLGVEVYPSITDLYISNDDPYGAELFLRQRDRQVSCVNSRYFEEIPSTAPGSNLTLHEWMYSYLGIRRHLRLVSADRKSLSAECLDTASTRPAEFLGFLKYLWPSEGALVLEDALLVDALKATEVPTMHGKMKRLDWTYLPLKPLLDLHRRFLDDEYFPFLQTLNFVDYDEDSHLWSFLTKYLAVGNQDDLSFRLSLMRYLKDANPNAEMLSNPSRVIDLYQSIDAFIRLYMDKDDELNIRNTFNTNELIFVPAWMSTKASWKYPEECLWDAPSDFTGKVPLKEIYSSSFQKLVVELDRIAGFFRETLEILDIESYDVINELEDLKLQPSVNAEVIQRLYGILFAKLPTEESDGESIPDYFETRALIYFDRNGNPEWYSPSECVWSDTTHIHGKIALNSQYEDLKDFFLEGLGVAELDLKMVLDQLLEAKNLKLREKEVRELLKTLNSFLRVEPNPPSPSRLLKASVFPVRDPNSGVTLCSSNIDFTLVDREGPPSEFKKKVRTLDFTLQEIRQLEPLFLWTRLESRYLSRCMKETSRLGDGVGTPILQPHRDIRRKAHALLRIAAAFNSPKFEADPHQLYDILRKAKTLESGVISSSLSLEQGGVVHEIEVGQSELHIEDGTPLTIYVPHDMESQECCFQCDLPRRFASWMMTEPTSGTEAKINDRAVKVISSILNCSVSTTGRILEKEGIPQTPEVPEEHDVPEAFSLVESGDDVENMTDAATPISKDLSVIPPRTPNRPPENERSSSPESVYSVVATTWSPPRVKLTRDQPTPFTDPEDYDSENSLGSQSSDDSDGLPQLDIPVQQSFSQYRRLLEGVVALAKRTRLSSNDGDRSLEDDPWVGLHYAPTKNDWENKKKVGAAGELFVFELLKRHLAEFDLPNWQSGIRRYANILPQYAGLEAWPKPETSDIVYDDKSGALTRAMISLGLLEADNWNGKKPKYYIEVKCTTGDCDTPFIVSQKQVDLMKENSNGIENEYNQTAVYAIFRVYNLGRKSMGLEIYMDPSEQKRVGKLLFKSAKYAVTPTRVL